MATPVARLPLSTLRTHSSETGPTWAATNSPSPSPVSSAATMPAGLPLRSAPRQPITRYRTVALGRSWAVAAAARGFGRLWTARAVSQLGDGVTTIAGPLLAATLTQIGRAHV